MKNIHSSDYRTNNFEINKNGHGFVDVCYATQELADEARKKQGVVLRKERPTRVPFVPLKGDL